MKKKSFLSKVGTYFKECYIELKKVVWPSWDSVKSNVVVVVVSVMIVAFILGFFDMALVRLINWVA